MNKFLSPNIKSKARVKIASALLVVVGSMQLTCFNALAMPADAKSSGSDYPTMSDQICSGFSQVQVETIKDTCLGLVADATQGLKMPRYSVQSKDNTIYISDMGSWGIETGTIWALEIQQDNQNSSSKKKVKLTNLFPNKKLTMPNGLLMDPEGRLYVGTPTGIFRFAPKNNQSNSYNLNANLELVENGFMQSIFRKTEYANSKSYNQMPPDQKNRHPLIQMAANKDFTEIYFNVGAPSDHCSQGIKTKNDLGLCVQSESSLVNAGIWKVKLSNNSERKTITTEAVARGLRNSMGLALHPITQKLYQAENSLDLKEENLPYEEINLIEPGAHYGWPYCHSNNQVTVEFKNVVSSKDCTTKYHPALINMPAHVAPLGLMFYQNQKIAALQGKMLVSWHGYRDAGQKVVSYSLDTQGMPLSPKPELIIFNWSAKLNVRPKGSPVGLTELNDGSVLVIDDKNSSVLILDQGDNYTSDNHSDGQIKISVEQINAIKPLMNFFTNTCSACHSEMRTSDPQKLIIGLIENKKINLNSKVESPLLVRVKNGSMPMGAPLSNTDKETVVKQIENFLKTF